jgi:hypothetical protein
LWVGNYNLNAISHIFNKTKVFCLNFVMPYCFLDSIKLISSILRFDNKPAANICRHYRMTQIEILKYILLEFKCFSTLLNPQVHKSLHNKCLLKKSVWWNKDERCLNLFLIKPIFIIYVRSQYFTHLCVQLSALGHSNSNNTLFQ